MNAPELINSSAPHRIAVDEGSRDAKGRKSYVVDDDRQPAVNSDDMADAMDAANRKKVSFSAETTTNAEKKESINHDLAVTKASVSESDVQDRSVSQPAPPKFKVAQPISIQTPTEDIIIPGAGTKITTPGHLEPDPEIADDMAHAIDSSARKEVSFSGDIAPQSGEKESIYPEVEVAKASVLESSDQDRPASPATLLKLEVAQPLSMQTPAEEISTEAAPSTVSKTTALEHPEPDPHIAARLDTLKAQNNAVRTSLDAFDSQSLAKA